MLVHVIVILTMPLVMVIWFLIQLGSGHETRPGWGLLDHHDHGASPSNAELNTGCDGQCATCPQRFQKPDCDL